MKTEDVGPELNEISNKNHVDDVNFALKHTRWLLTILGIWSYVVSKPSRIGRYASKLLLPLPSLSLTIFAIPMITSLIARRSERRRVLTLLAPLIFRLSNVLKNLILVSRRDSLKYYIRHMATDWQSLESEEHRQIMIRNLRTGHGLTMKFVVAMYSSGIIYQVILPLSKGSTVNKLNVTVKPMPLAGAGIFVNLDYGCNYEIVYCGFCFASFLLYTSAAAVVNLGATLMSHACGQIDIVVSRLDDIIGSDRQSTERVVNNRIRSAVRCHVRLLRFVSGIDDTLRTICFVDIVGLTLVICTLEYLTMTAWGHHSHVTTLTDIMMMITFSSNIFIFCHIGELLGEQCQRVSRATYMTDWHRLTGKSGQGLVLIMAMSNYPRRLTAGGMMELSYLSFGNIMKTTFAYLGMLQSMAG